MSVDPAPLDRLHGSVDGALHADLDRTRGFAARAIRCVAFWIAALLPFAYLPLLATGVVERHPVAFGALVCCNAGAFVLGHGYRDDARPV
ncbi:MAG: hypothetical protein ABEJ08_01580 [Halobacteriaceae archaeon]